MSSSWRGRVDLFEDYRNSNNILDGNSIWVTQADETSDADSWPDVETLIAVGQSDFPDQIRRNRAYQDNNMVSSPYYRTTDMDKNKIVNRKIEAVFPSDRIPTPNKYREERIEKRSFSDLEREVYSTASLPNTHHHHNPHHHQPSQRRHDKLTTKPGNYYSDDGRDVGKYGFSKLVPLSTIYGRHILSNESARAKLNPLYVEEETAPKARQRTPDIIQSSEDMPICPTVPPTDYSDTSSIRPVEGGQGGLVGRVEPGQFDGGRLEAPYDGVRFPRTPIHEDEMTHRHGPVDLVDNFSMETARRQESRPVTSQRPTVTSQRPSVTSERGKVTSERMIQETALTVHSEPSLHRSRTDPTSTENLTVETKPPRLGVKRSWVIVFLVGMMIVLGVTGIALIIYYTTKNNSELEGIPR